MMCSEMDEFLPAYTDTDDGSDDCVDEELRRDLYSLKAVLEGHAGPSDADPGPSWLCGELEGGGEERDGVGGLDTVKELHSLLQKNWQLQGVLSDQLQKVEHLCEVNEVRRRKVQHYGKRVAFNLRRFTKGSYFSDHQGAFPSVKAADRPEEFHAFYSKDILWGSSREKKLKDGVRQQAIDIRTHPLQQKLGVVESRRQKSNIRQQIQAIQKLPDKELLGNTSGINWDMIAFEVFSNKKSPRDCQLHWDNVLSQAINTGPWSGSEDKKLLKLAQQRNCTDWNAIAKELNTGRSAFACLQRYQRSLNPKMLKSEWTKEDDNALREAFNKYGSRNWKAVSVYVGNNRTAQQCLHRWHYTLKPGIKKGRWSLEEDQLLRQAVKCIGVGNWSGISDSVPGRTPMQCRERWVNILDDRLNHGPWSKQEDEKLIQLCQEYRSSSGSIKWSKVATQMGSRTDNMCMKRWRFLTPMEEVLAHYTTRAKCKDMLGSNFQGRGREKPTLSAKDLEEDMLSQEAREKIRKYETKVQTIKRNLAWHTGRVNLPSSVPESAGPLPESEPIPENEYEFYGSILKARTAAKRRQALKRGKRTRRRRTAKDTTQELASGQPSCPSTELQSPSAPMYTAPPPTVVISSVPVDEQSYPTMYELSATYLHEYASRLWLTSEQDERPALPTSCASVNPPPTSVPTPASPQASQDYLRTDSIPSPSRITSSVRLVLPEKRVSSREEDPEVASRAYESTAEVTDIPTSSTAVSTTAAASDPVSFTQPPASQVPQRTNPESAVSAAVQALLDLNEHNLESVSSCTPPFQVVDSMRSSDSPRYTDSPLSVSSDSSSTSVAETFCRPFSYADPLFPRESTPRWSGMAHPLHEAASLPVCSAPLNTLQDLPRGGVQSCAGTTQQVPHTTMLMASVTHDGTMHSLANVTSRTVHSTYITPGMRRSVQPPTTAAPVPAPVTPVPASVTPVPASTTPVPASTTRVSAPVTPVPAPVTPVPASVTPVPASTTPVPASMTPVPASTTPVDQASQTTGLQPRSTSFNVLPTFPQRTSDSVVCRETVPSVGMKSFRLLTSFPARSAIWTMVSSSTNVSPTPAVSAGTPSLPANLAVSSSSSSSAASLRPLTMPPLISVLPVSPLRSGSIHRRNPSITVLHAPRLTTQELVTPLRSGSMHRTNLPTSLKGRRIATALLGSSRGEGPLVVKDCEFFLEEDELMIVQLENPVRILPELHNSERQVQPHPTVSSDLETSVGSEAAEHVDTSVGTQTVGSDGRQVSNDPCTSGDQGKGSDIAGSPGRKRSLSKANDETGPSKKKRRSSQAGARPRGGIKSGRPEARAQPSPQEAQPGAGQSSQSPLLQQSDVFSRVKRGRGGRRRRRAVLSASPPAAGRQDLGHCTQK